jgi:hypothetical protein
MPTLENLSVAGRKWLVAVSAVLLAAVIVLSIFLGLQRKSKPPASPSAARAPNPVRELGGAGIYAGSPIGSASGSTTNKVMPLLWDAAEGEYLISFYAGATLITAAFDTGSARFVVATQASAAAGAPYYNPDSSTATALTDPRTGLPCTSNIAYVSQTDTIRVYQDTVKFPQVLIQAGQLCTQSVTTVVSTSPMGTPLTVTTFPVAAVTSTGPTLNVFGMSSVMSSTTFVDSTGKTLYLLPSCQTSAAPKYEAAIIQSFADYYTTAKQDVVWSMMLGTAPSAASPSTPTIAGMAAFGPLGTDCLVPQFTPMVPALPLASSPLGLTPSRYYVVEVLYAAVGIANTGLAAFTKLPGFPKYLLVDSGTTNVLLPGSQGPTNCQAFNGLVANQEAIIMLKNNVGITYRQADVTYNNGASNVFTPMDDGTATSFSSALDVGILGSTGMRNLYVEFNLTQSKIGFAQLLS